MCLTTLINYACRRLLYYQENGRLCLKLLIFGLIHLVNYHQKMTWNIHPLWSNVTCTLIITTPPCRSAFIEFLKNNNYDLPLPNFVPIDVIFHRYPVSYDNVSQDYTETVTATPHCPVTLFNPFSTHRSPSHTPVSSSSSHSINKTSGYKRTLEDEDTQVCVGVVLWAGKGVWIIMITFNFLGLYSYWSCS